MKLSLLKTIKEYLETVPFILFFLLPPLLIILAGFYCNQLYQEHQNLFLAVFAWVGMSGIVLLIWFLVFYNVLKKGGLINI